MIPDKFTNRLNSIIPADRYSLVLESFKEKPYRSFRLNLLKADAHKVFDQMVGLGIELITHDLVDHAYLVKNQDVQMIKDLGLFEQGLIYWQSYASLLVPTLFDLSKGGEILDMCAAPGSKTSQIAAIMNNNGHILACESVKKRYYKLKAVMQQLGVTNATCKLTDARRLSLSNQFSYILLDAPCSSEGRFMENNPKSYKYWSVRKIREMAKKQKGLIRHAARLLKPGGTLVYSTCTFAPEENEAVVNWLLRKENNMMVDKIELNEVECLPALERWNNKEFSNQIKNCIRIHPNDKTEGFFMARIKKVVS